MCIENMCQNVNYMGDSTLNNMEEGNDKDNTLIPQIHTLEQLSFDSNYLTKIIIILQVAVEDMFWNLIKHLGKIGNL